MSSESKTRSARPTNPFPGGLLVLGPGGEVLEAPRFFHDALELPDARAPSVFHLFDAERETHLVFERVIRRGAQIFEFFIRLIAPHGPPRGFRYWSVSPSHRAHKNTPITFYIVDESPLLQAQEWQLRRVRRDMLNHAQASISTYVRDRLAGVHSLIEVMRDTPSLAAESAPRALEALGAVLGSLDELLDVNVVRDDPDAERVALTEIAGVVQAWGEFERPVRAEVSGELGDALVPTEALERIVLPLVRNAIEASAPGGEVRVGIEETGYGFVRVDVVDRGEGMAPPILARAEDPFFSTKSAHLGLGLGQALDALRSTGGSWKIESSPRHGTRVTVLLPTDDPVELALLDDAFTRNERAAESE